MINVMAGVLLVLIITSSAECRGGPKYNHDAISPKLQDEIDNIYDDNKQDLYNGGRISSATITTLTVTTCTGCAAATNTATTVNGAQKSVTNTAYTAFSSFSTAITPSDATKKILVIMSGTYASTVAADCFFTLLRGATNIGHELEMTKTEIGMAIHVIDSPLTASATTYFVAAKEAGGGTCRINNGVTLSAIQL